MTRKEFVRICGLLGIALPTHKVLLACDKGSEPSNPFSGQVIIIGAGAGGMTAGYLLNQQGTDFKILEASPVHGGRMKINSDFADFPIPLGAEWLETRPSIFEKIVNNPSVQVNVETVRDAPDRKFVNYSWYQFFEEYIVPSISDRISYNSVVTSIDYSGEKIKVETQNGNFLADKVIISVPLKVLQDSDISFTPALPPQKSKAIQEPLIWEGFKAFFEFSTRFYGDGVLISSDIDGQKGFYDAAYGQPSRRNILGLFTVGKPAQEYIGLGEDQLKERILQELDVIFDQQASPNYVKHISQDWNNEPFIKSGYMSDHANWRTVRELGNPISDKVYFAGGAYTDGEDWVSVHTAAQSAIHAIEAINK